MLILRVSELKKYNMDCLAFDPGWEAEIRLVSANWMHMGMNIVKSLNSGSSKSSLTCRGVRMRARARREKETEEHASK